MSLPLYCVSLLSDFKTRPRHIPKRSKICVAPLQNVETIALVRKLPSCVQSGSILVYLFEKNSKTAINAVGFSI
jgi:hypothetical protein